MQFDISYVVTVSPEYQREALMLIDSIEKNSNDGEIFVFYTEEEEEDLNSRMLRSLKGSYNLIKGNMPIEGYPLAAPIKGLEMASDMSESDYLVFLDTDTYFLDKMDFLDRSDADLYICPSWRKEGYWLKEESNDEWRQLFNEHGFDIEEARSTNCSLDGEEVWPAKYNSGIVVVKNNDLPSRWMELTKKLHGSISHDRYADQVALAILSSEYEVCELSNRYNFPMCQYLFPPSDLKFMHYIAVYDFYRGVLLNPGLWNRVSLSSLREGLRGREIDVLGKLPYNFLRTVYQVAKRNS